VPPGAVAPLPDWRSRPLSPCGLDIALQVYGEVIAGPPKSLSEQPLAVSPAWCSVGGNGCSPCPTPLVQPHGSRATPFSTHCQPATRLEMPKQVELQRVELPPCHGPQGFNPSCPHRCTTHEHAAKERLHPCRSGQGGDNSSIGAIDSGRKMLDTKLCLGS
jgi:hypothetical protein